MFVHCRKLQISYLLKSINVLFIDVAIMKWNIEWTIDKDELFLKNYLVCFCPLSGGYNLFNYD